MKKIFLPLIILLTVASGSAWAQEQLSDSGDVPFDNWAYPALSKLIEWGEVEKAWTGSARRPMSRWEFAVALRRWLDRHPAEDVPQQSQVRDVVTALAYEFAYEIARLDDRRPRRLDWPQLPDSYFPLITLRHSTRASDWFKVWVKAPRGPVYPPYEKPVIITTFLRRREQNYANEKK